MDTTQLYYYFFHKTPNMILKSKYGTCLCPRKVELEVKNESFVLIEMMCKLLPGTKGTFWFSSNFRSGNDFSSISRI